MITYSKFGDNMVRAWMGMSWADFSLNGDLIRLNPEHPLYERFSDDEIKEASEAIKKLESAPFENVYLRFGELPKDGRSTNWATGEKENGVSCYRICWKLIDGAYDLTGDGLVGALIAYSLKGEQAYFITGEEVGVGSDGEAVLKNAKIVAKAKQTKKGFVVEG